MVVQKTGGLIPSKPEFSTGKVSVVCHQSAEGFCSFTCQVLWLTAQTSEEWLNDDSFSNSLKRALVLIFFFYNFVINTARFNLVYFLTGTRACISYSGRVLCLNLFVQQEETFWNIAEETLNQISQVCFKVFQLVYTWLIHLTGLQMINLTWIYFCILELLK